MAKVKHVVYLHGDKEAMYDEGEELGMNEEACSTFAYALYEVGIELMVDTDTGDSEIIRILT